MPRRFWHYVAVAEDVPSDDPCWLWTGNATIDGFGQWSFKNNSLYCVHSIMYAATGKSMIDSTYRRCGNNRCLNPAHISSAPLAALINAHRPVGTTGYRGVTGQGDRFVARARGPRNSEGRHPMVTIGVYPTAEAAAEAYVAYVMSGGRPPVVDTSVLRARWDRVRAARTAATRAAARLRSDLTQIPDWEDIAPHLDEIDTFIAMWVDAERKRIWGDTFT